MSNIREIGANSFLVLEAGIIIGAVWKAPSPFNDWYWGKVKVTRHTYDLVACGVEDNKEMAAKACRNPDNRKYLLPGPNESEG